MNTETTITAILHKQIIDKLHAEIALLKLESKMNKIDLIAEIAPAFERVLKSGNPDVKMCLDSLLEIQKAIISFSGKN